MPTILFLDQPSQVYFPAVIDFSTEKFDAEKLKEKEKGEKGRKIEQIKNLYRIKNKFGMMI